MGGAEAGGHKARSAARYWAGHLRSLGVMRSPVGWLSLALCLHGLKSGESARSVREGRVDEEGETSEVVVWSEMARKDSSQCS